MSKKYNNAEFNDDATNLTFANSESFISYDIDNSKKNVGLTNPTIGKLESEIQVAKRYLNSNIFVFVKDKARTKISIYDMTAKMEMAMLSTDVEIIDIKLTKKYIVLITLNTVVIYSMIRFSKIIELITAENVDGLIGISDEEFCYISYPSCDEQINVYNVDNCEFTYKLNAHKHQIHTMELNNEGTILATASNYGTIIRLWNIKENKMMYEYRVCYWWNIIKSFSFSPDNRYLLINLNDQYLYVHDINAKCNICQITLSETECRHKIIKCDNDYIIHYINRRGNYKRYVLKNNGVELLVNQIV